MLIWGDGKPGRLVIAEGRAWVDLTFSTFFHYKACGGGKGKGKKEEGKRKGKGSGKRKRPAGKRESK